MLIACPACLSTNRVPEDRLADGPVCGRCGRDLTPTDPIALDDRSLPLYLQRTEQPVLVDFWAAWCGPCRSMAPQFARAAQALPGVRFAKVDSDASPQAGTRHGIRSIPTLILFDRSSEVGRVSGALPAQDIVTWVQRQVQATA